MGEHKMHRITAYDSVSGRHAAYQRELERLATEVEDWETVIRALPEREAQYIADRMGEAMARIFAAGRAGASHT